MELSGWVSVQMLIAKSDVWEVLVTVFIWIGVLSFVIGAHLLMPPLFPIEMPAPPRYPWLPPVLLLVGIVAVVVAIWVG